MVDPFVRLLESLYKTDISVQALLFLIVYLYPFSNSNSPKSNSSYFLVPFVY